MKTIIISRFTHCHYAFVLALLALTLATPATYAANITKAATGTDLTAGASWTGNVAPGSGDVAVWDTGSLGTGLTLNSGTTNWLGIKVNAGATDPINIGSGGTLTLGAGGIDLSAATINASIGSGLALGAGNQLWNLKAGSSRTLTVSGAFTRSIGSTLMITTNATSGIGTVAFNPTLVNGIVGSWAVMTNSGTAANNSALGYTFATTSGVNVAAYTGATPETTTASAWGGIGSGGSGTVNYDISITGTPGQTGLNRNVNTLRYTGGSAGFNQQGNNTGLLLNANGILNAGAGTLTLASGGSVYGIAPSTANELVLAAASAPITIFAYIANSNNPIASSVTIVGPSTVTLAGANTYTGNTCVNSGTLFLSGTLVSANTLVTGGTLTASTAAGSSATPITVASGAIAGVLLASAGTQWTDTSNLTQNAGSELDINFTNFVPSTAVAPLKVNNFSASATTTVRILASTTAGLTPGATFPLVTWTGTGPADATAFTLVPPAGITGHLTVANSALNLVVDSNTGSGLLSWNTGNGAWDTTTPNWIDTNSNPATYADTASAVLFDDAASASGNPVVTNNSVLTPVAVTMNSASHSYTLTGTGALTGTGPLIVQNGTLTLAATNNLTGSTTVRGGTLQLAAPGTLGAANNAVILGGGTLDLGATLATNGAVTISGGTLQNGTLFGTAFTANNAGTATITATLAGTGTLTKSGGGTLILAASNTFAGNVFGKGGTILLNNGSINNGGNYSSIGQSGSDVATLTLAGTGAFTNTADLNAGDIGASVGTINLQDSAVLSVQNLYLGSANAAGSTASGTLNLNGGTLIQKNTAVGSFVVGGRNSGNAGGGTGVLNLTNGYLSVACGVRVGDYGTGTINQYGGLFEVTNGSTGINLHRETNLVSYGTYHLNGGILRTEKITTSFTNNSLFYFNGGTVQAGSGNLGATPFMNVLVHAYVRNGGAILDDRGYIIIISQPLEHSTVGGDNAIDGGLTKLGAGLITITTTNTYTGPTKVLAGTLKFSAVAPLAGGDLLVSNATLIADGSSGTPVSVGNITLNAGAVLNLTNNASAYVISGTGALVIQSNTTVNLNYGALVANPTAGAITNAGGITVVGTTNVINIAGSGFAVGQFPLIKYGSGTLASLSGFKLGTLPPGVNAALVNNTGNHSVDLNITFIGQTLTWYGADNVGNLLTNWDINTTADWNSGTLKYLEYSGNTFGDLVTFDDSLYNNSINPQSTNVNLTTTLHPSQITVNSLLPYSFTGTGSLAGAGALLKNGSGSLTLLVSNNLTGGTFINGGTLVITNDNALGTNSMALTLGGGVLQFASGTTNNTRAIMVTANSMINVPSNIVVQAGGLISGVGSLMKTNGGTLVLSGSNSITGALAANGGTLTTIGTNILSAVPVVGNAAGFNGVLNVAGGLFQDNNNPANVFNSSLSVGSVAGAAGSMIVSGGTVTIPKQLTVGGAGYGAFNQSGGTTIVGGFIALGGNANGGVFNQSGGSISLTNSSATIGYSATTTYGVMNLGGNASFNVGGAGNGVWPGEVGNGMLNVADNAALTITNYGVSLGRGNAGGKGTVNLNGGTITANFITNGPGNGTFNFNGGTLKANASGQFTAGTVVTAFNVYSNGAVIDDGGNNITWSQPLQGATSGYGLADILLGDGSGGGFGSGYVAPPVVVITDTITNPTTLMPIGSNATAVAQIDPVNGTVTNVIITCPGSGFDPFNSTLSIAFIGGGASPTAPLIYNYDYIPLNPGGLTKQGSGTLTLSGANTYTGPTMVTNGELFITPAHQAGGAVSVADGAKLGVSTSSTTAGAVIGALTLGTSGATTLDFSYGISGNPTHAALTAGAVTVHGNSSIHIAGSFALGTFPLIKYASLSGSFNPTVVAPRGVTAAVANDGAHATLNIVISSVGGGIVWSGTNSAAPNVWDINTTANWLTGTSATTYQEGTPPGDAVSFNDAGSGAVLLSNTVDPANVTFSNNAVNYVVSGTGQINSALGLTKVGSGTVALNVAGAYAGGVTVSGGALNLGASQTFVNLSGTGAVGTASDTPMLTVNDTTNTVFGGVLSGALGLTKTGNGTLRLTATNTFTGNVFGRGGVLVLEGAQISDGGSYSSIGQLDGDVAVLWLQGAATFTNTSDFNVGDLGASAGTLAIQDSAVVSVQNLFIGSANAAGSTASGTINLTGGKLMEKNGAAGNFSIGGRNSGNAGNGVGVLNLTNGYVIAACGIRVGDYGTGTINQYGGLLEATNNATGINLHRQNTSGSGTYNLNGGVLRTEKVTSSQTTGTSVLYLNGGLLQAANGNLGTTPFMNNLQHVYVRDGGAIIDSQSYNIIFNQAMEHSPVGGDNGTDGGLVKLGTGAMYLDGFTSFTGNTVVSNGTLAGIGGVSGNVVVPSAGTGSLGAGDAATNGTFSVGGNLSLGASATLRISKSGGVRTNDQVAVTGSISYGGVLNVVNITGDGTPLAVGDQFQVFNKGGSGNFTAILGASGVTYTFDSTTGILTVSSLGPGTFTNKTGITSIVLNGANVVITGTNGQSGDAYYLLQSTNVALPLAQWKTVATNVLSSNGNYTFIGTNAVAPGDTQQFYILSNTNANH